MRVAIVAAKLTSTNAALVETASSGSVWEFLPPQCALARLEPGDVALGRIDVRRTLDGVDDGLWALGELSARGVTVLNGPPALLAAHDKLLTARILHHGHLPHPATQIVYGDQPSVTLTPPLVLKPRFGSWGLGVTLCEDDDAVAAALDAARDEPWYRAHGALVQELVPPLGFDLRVVVAGDEIVGAISRVAPAGEWRTNVALGARREPVVPSPTVSALALTAARTVGAAFVGVDLLPDGFGGWTILELNGAVEVTSEYSLGMKGDVFRDACTALVRRAEKDRSTRQDVLRMA